MTVGLWAAALATSVAGSADDVAERLHERLLWATELWVKQRRAEVLAKVPARTSVVLGVRLRSDGELIGVDVSRPSPWRQVDKLAEQLLRDAAAQLAGGNPLLAGNEDDEVLGGSDAAAKSDGPEVVCALRCQLNTEAGLDFVTVCIPAGEPAWVGGCDLLHDATSSAEGNLFSGWCLDAGGDPVKGLASFRRALASAPQWDLAILSMGLALARSGRTEAARPHLERYARNHPVSSEVKAYLTGVGVDAAFATTDLARGSVTADGLLEVARCERDQKQIMAYIQAHLERLSDCVAAEQKRRPHLDMPPRLPIDFVIEPTGKIHGAGVDHRFFREGPLRECVVDVLQDRLKGHRGGDCPARFELEVDVIKHTQER